MECMEVGISTVRSTQCVKLVLLVQQVNSVLIKESVFAPLLDTTMFPVTESYTTSQGETPTVIVATTVFEELITDTVLDTEFATYTILELDAYARDLGADPTVTLDETEVALLNV